YLDEKEFQDVAFRELGADGPRRVARVAGARKPADRRGLRRPATAFPRCVGGACPRAARRPRLRATRVLRLTDGRWTARAVHGVRTALQVPRAATVLHPLGPPCAAVRRLPTQVPLLPPPGKSVLHAPARPPQPASLLQCAHARPAHHPRVPCTPT